MTIPDPSGDRSFAARERLYMNTAATTINASATIPTTIPTMAPVDNPLLWEPGDDEGLDVGVAAPPEELDSSTVQTPCQESFQVFVDLTMVVSSAPITVAGFSDGVLNPGACARNHTPFSIPVAEPQFTLMKAACKNALPSS
jgi:hypothetical protein